MEEDILMYAEDMQCHELHMFLDEATGLKAIIAIHDTSLGPALGGCRCLPYSSSHAAIVDSIRLAQGMTYKAAISNLPLGGGKAVLMKPKHIHDREAYFRAFGRIIESLKGRYITAVDSGTSTEDMDIIATVTDHVTTTTHTMFTLADPSSLTAHGVRRGIQAAIKFKLNQDSLNDIHVAVQGLGHTGYSLVRELHNHGVKLTVFDINTQAMERCVKEFNVHTVQSLEEILALDCDVFAPCALGAIVNDQSIAELKAPIIAGSANNQLQDSKHGKILAERGVLYAPDYVINAGGLIYVAAQYSHITEDEALTKIEEIYDILMQIFIRAEQEKRPTNEIADMLAQERLKKR